MILSIQNYKIINLFFLMKQKLKLSININKYQKYYNFFPFLAQAMKEYKPGYRDIISFDPFFFGTALTTSDDNADNIANPKGFI